MSVKFDANSFIDDPYLATLDFADLLRNAYSGQFWGVLGDFDLLKL